MSPFDGAAVVVTGAGSGVGRGTALAFAAQGARVVVAERDEQSGAETARRIAQAGGTGVFVPTDVAREADVERAVEKALALAPRLAVFVNNAGVLGAWVPLVEQSAATLDAVLGVNVKGVVYPGAALYAASKAAVVSLTKAAALELGPAAVRVVGVAPGPIDTPMLRSAAAEWPPAIQKDVPLVRIGESDDVARAIVWLASPAASYITGAIVPVDGGFLAP